VRIFLHLAMGIGFAVLLCLAGSSALHGQTANSIALRGRVSSRVEGLMEGVLVTARKEGASFTVTAVTNEHGRYSFPRRNLVPGVYHLRMRAIGYDLAGSSVVQVTPDRTALFNLTLRKTPDLASQLTTAEWLNSVPGTHEQKIFLLSCASCHTLQRVLKSRYTAQQWPSVFRRMSEYDPEASTLRAQKGSEPTPQGSPEQLKQMAEYLSTINLSRQGKWNFPLRPLPRPRGRATHIIITEYDLPRKDGLPHDVDADHLGNIWYSDSGWMYLGKLDAKTGKAVEYPIQVFDPDKPLGTVDVEMDKQGSLWLGLMEQGSKIAKFDPKSEKFTYWDLPQQTGQNVIAPRVAFQAPYHDDVDGKVWVTNVTGMVYRLDIRSGRAEAFNVFEKIPGGQRGHLIYQVLADSRNNGYFLEWVGGGVGRVDAKTGKVTFYPTPTRNSFSRRGHFDSQDHLWFAEFFANRIGMFDPKTNQFREWKVPTPWFAPYDVAPDKNGEIWASSLSADRVDRFDHKTGKTIEYLLPRYTDARKVSLEDYSVGKLTVWLPNKNNASILKLEPLD
jgi:virginiamycin B lyase